MKLSSGLLIVLVSIVVGCAAHEPQTVSHDLMPAQNERGAENNLRDLVTNYLVHYIGLKAGLQVDRTASPDGVIELVSEKDNEKVILTVRGLELSSVDILSQPVKAVLSLDLMVIDSKGDQVYRGSVTGGYEALIDFFMESKETIANLLVKDALKKFVNDPAFKRIMAKHKYGTLGSIVPLF